MKLTLTAAGLLFCGAVQAAETSPPPLPVIPEQPVVQMPRLSCDPVGHPNAMCFWFDPGVQNCFPDVLSANPVGYPAIHPFNGGEPICWSGYQGFISIIKKVGG
jgi:hypothetical protein